jgi:hypothetical protein
LLRRAAANRDPFQLRDAALLEPETGARDVWIADNRGGYLHRVLAE